MWWHFALGKYYITHHTMKIDHSIFSWTPANPDWRYNTWLGSTIEYLFYASSGGFGIWLFQWGIFIGIYLFFLSYVRSIQGKLDINAISLIFITAIAEGFELRIPKPELFTPLFFTALLYVFFSVKRVRISPLYLYLYPILFVLWVNLHGGFIVGLLTVLILFLTEGLNFVIFKRGAVSPRILFHLACSLILIIFACLINPYGLAYPWDTIFVNYPLLKQITGERSQLMSSNILHWQMWSFLLHPSKSIWWYTAWIMILMLFLLLGITFAAYKKKRGVDLTLLFPNLLLFYYGMNTARASIFFPIFSFFSIYFTIEKADVFLKVKRFTLFSMIFFLFFSAAVMFRLTHTSCFNFFGMNLQETVPIEEVEFIKKFKLPPPLFNDALSGSYMIWSMYPKYKVFIDTRFGPYDTTQVGTDIYWITHNFTKENFERFNTKYPFRVALVNFVDIDIILEILNYNGNDWSVLFLGKNAAILIHKSLIPTLNVNLLRSIDSDPIKFRDLKNPAALASLFLIYISNSSKAGDVIKEIYRKNVSNFYSLKYEQLRVMEIMISKKSAEENEMKVLQ
jgi:hypothetical protein